MKHVALGPIVSPGVEKALALNTVRRTRWQEGIARAANAFAEPRSAFGLTQAVVGAVVGAVVATLPHGLPVWARAVLVGVGAVVAYWLVPTLWAVIGAAAARELQFGEAVRELGRLRQQLVEDREAAQQRYEANDQNWRLSMERDQAIMNNLREQLYEATTERDALRAQHAALYEESMRAARAVRSELSENQQILAIYLEALEKLPPHQGLHYANGFRLNDQGWRMHQARLSVAPDLYSALDRTYLEIARLNRMIAHRETGASGLFGVNRQEDRLEEVYVAVTVGIDSLNGYLDASI